MAKIPVGEKTMSFRRTATTGLAATSLAALIAGPVLAESEVELLRKQLKALEQRLIELEAREAATEVKVDEAIETIETEVVKSGDGLGTFILPGTDTRISISGYVKGDFIYDLGGSIGSDDLFVPESIAIGGENDPRFTAHARQSRLTIRTTTPSDFGPVKTLFEGDFFGAPGNEVISNSTSFRLRHAYGEVGPVAGGQFWTNFMPIEAYPSTVDFQGPAGIPFIRQAQLRWTQPVTDNFTFIGSLENSEFSGQAIDVNDVDGDGDVTDLLLFGESIGPLAGVAAGIDVAPDIVATGIYRGDFGLVRASAIGRRFGGQGAGDGAFGWGLNLGGNLKLTDTTRLLASVTGGNGVGRYIINGFGQDGVIDANGDVDSIASFGLTAQVQQKLTDDLTGALAYGRYDVTDSVSPTAVDSLQTIHASLFWRPVDRVTFGAEAILGLIENQAGLDDSAIRLQTSIQVNF